MEHKNFVSSEPDSQKVNFEDFYGIFHSLPCGTCGIDNMLTCPILSPYLSGPWSWIECQCHNDHAGLSSVTTSMAEFDFPGFILAGFIASKNVNLPYFGGPWMDCQCHSEMISNQQHYQFGVQILGQGPCGFPSVWISTSNAKFCSA